MKPDDYCQDKTAKSGSSFYYSFMFLPEAQRKAITALYAFCREVDDVVDECHDPELARSKLIGGVLKSLAPLMTNPTIPFARL